MAKVLRQNNKFIIYALLTLALSVSFPAHINAAISPLGAKNTCPTYASQNERDNQESKAKELVRQTLEKSLIPKDWESEGIEQSGHCKNGMLTISLNYNVPKNLSQWGLQYQISTPDFTISESGIINSTNRNKVRNFIEQIPQIIKQVEKNQKVGQAKQLLQSQDAVLEPSLNVIRYDLVGGQYTLEYDYTQHAVTSYYLPEQRPWKHFPEISAYETLLTKFGPSCILTSSHGLKPTFRGIDARYVKRPLPGWNLAVRTVEWRAFERQCLPNTSVGIYIYNNGTYLAQINAKVYKGATPK